MENKFEEHKNLVLKFCTRYLKSNAYEDLVSVGNIGLLSAIKTYNPDLGFTFSTYAHSCIKNEIYEYIRKNKNHIISDISLDATIKGSEDRLSLSDILEDDFDMFNYISDDDKILKEIKSNLNGKETLIQDMKLSGMTFKSIAAEFNVSKQRISKIFEGVRNKLSYIKPYLRGETDEIPNKNKTELSMEC